MVQVDTQNSEGQTVMHLTCIQGDENSLRVLFMAKANCSIGDLEQRSPIHLAAERGFTRCVAEASRTPFPAIIHLSF